MTFPIKVDIIDLLSHSDDLVFLAGSGISLLSPTCIPKGGDFVDAIASLVFPDAEIKGLMQKCNPRFEEILGIYRDTLDQSLSILSVFDGRSGPNIQHDFLADHLFKNHPVFTTNFDSCIEQSADNRGFIPPVDVAVTEAEFLSNTGSTNTLYKIHGSTKNIVTGLPTRKTVITTMDAIGMVHGKHGLMSIEPWKEAAFLSVVKNKILVVLGYSGSDDFDVTPMLKKASDLQAIVWIQYSPNVNPCQTVSEYDFSQQLALNNLKCLTPHVRVYLVICDTTMLVEHVYQHNRALYQPPADLHAWFTHHHIKPLPEWRKWYRAALFYGNREQFPDDALRCIDSAILEKGCDIPCCQNYAGGILVDKRDFSSAIARYDAADAAVKKVLSDPTSSIQDQNEAHVQCAKLNINYANWFIEQTRVLYYLDKSPLPIIENLIQNLEVTIIFLHNRLVRDLDVSTTTDLTRAFEARGVLKRLRKDFVGSRQDFSNALIWARMEGLQLDMAHIEANITVISRLLRDVPINISDWGSIVAEAQQLRTPLSQSQFYHAIGQELRDSGKIDDALVAFKKSFRLAFENRYSEGIFICTLEIIDTFLVHKDFHDKTIQAEIGRWGMMLVFIAIPNAECDDAIPNAFERLKKIHQSMNQTDLLIENIEEILEYLKECNSPNRKEQLNGELAKYKKEV